MEHLAEVLRHSETAASLFNNRKFCNHNAEVMRYHCDLCGETPEPVKGAYGLYFRSPCACSRQRRARRMAEQERDFQQAVLAEQLRYTYEWLGPRFTSRAVATHTFDTFTAALQPYAFQTAVNWVRDPQGVLIFHGPFGTGKTHLLAAVCNELRKEYKCRFVTAPNLFLAIQHSIRQSKMREGSGEYVEDWTKFVDKVTDPNVIFFLDDVDKAHYTEFHEEVYHAVIDARINANAPMAMTTNHLYDLDGNDELANYMGGSIADRLYVGRIEAEFFGESYRKRMSLLTDNKGA